jgi:8-hydroxy-5-deazaflavin:NADPH oxidoreductase
MNTQNPDRPEDSMEIGFIGVGAIANAIAGHLASTGHPVTLASRRGPDSLREQVAALGPPARAGTRAEAAAAQMVFLSVMWGDIDAALSGLPDWDGRILVDTTNQFDQVDGQYVPVDTRASFGVETGSEVVASKAPDARVIKAFNTLFAPTSPATRATTAASACCSTAATTPAPRAPSRASPPRPAGSR